ALLQADQIRCGGEAAAILRPLVSSSDELGGRCRSEAKDSRPRTAMDDRRPRARAGAPRGAPPNDLIRISIDRRACAMRWGPFQAATGRVGAKPSLATTGRAAPRSVNRASKLLVWFRAA